MVHAPSSAGAPVSSAVGTVSREQTRARYPDVEGFVERDGVRVFYEVCGSSEPTIMLLPTWSIVHSRIWKLQIADLARRFRVITFDPRGNGRSDRPTNVQAYAEAEYAADALAVMDATASKRVVLVSLSQGAQRAILLASERGERVAGAVFIGPALPMGSTARGRQVVGAFMDRLDSDEGWAKFNGPYWRRDFRGFLEFFFGECFSELHSTKPTDDSVGWGAETDAESLILSQLGPGLRDREEVLARCARITCPVLVIHGTDDRIRPQSDGETLADATRGRFISIEGGGHIPNVREPVLVNLLIRDFVRGIAEEAIG